MKLTFKKIAAVMCALALGTFALAGCSQAAKSEGSKNTTPAAQADDSANISKLIVGFDNSYPPYGYIGEGGEYVGFDIDLAKKVAEKNGWEIELMPIDWDAKDALLNQGTINCVWNGFTIEGREDGYTFSEPYMLNQQVVVTKAGSPINSLADLSGKTVLTQIGSAALALFEEEGDQVELAKTFGRLDTVSDYNNAFMQLESGTVDAVACDLSIAAYQMAAKPNAYKQLSESLSSEHYGVGFKKGSEALAKKVTDTLRQLYADGTVSAICAKYADQGLAESNWILK